MKTFTLNSINKIYLNSYRPLCFTDFGIKAIEKYNYPKYIDASCRREPDIQNPYPTISAICRQGLFAPRLKVNDIVVYLSVKRTYPPENKAGNKLIAILKIAEVFKNHDEGYDWYLQNGFPIPSNCIVDNNPPYGFDHTAGNFENKAQIINHLEKSEEQQKVVGLRRLQHWDDSYKEKVSKWSMFIRSEPIYIEYDEPVTLFKEDLESIFGSMNTNTRNPKSISLHHLKKLALFAGVNIQVNNNDEKGFE